MITNGTIIQTFLLESGMKEEAVNIFFSVLQIVQILIMLLFAKKLDKQKNPLNKFTLSGFLNLPFFTFLLIMCFFNMRYTNALLIPLGLTALFYCVFLGLNNIYSYKCPYHIIDMKKYGKLSANAGAISGAVCFILSILFSFIQNKTNYAFFSKMAFVINLLCGLLFIITLKSIKPIEYTAPENASEKKNINILAYKPFYKLIIPNLLRGFNMGIFAMAATIGYYNKCLDSASASILVIVMNISTFLGTVGYSKVSEKYSDKNILLISSILVCALTSLMLVKQNPVFFISLYAVGYFFLTFVNYSVPVAVTKIVRYDVIAQYNGGRMLLNTAGTSIAGFVCIALFDTIGPHITMIIAGSTQLISGICYYLYLKNNPLEGVQ